MAEHDPRCVGTFPGGRPFHVKDCPEGDHRPLAPEFPALTPGMREWWVGGDLKLHRHPLRWLVWLLDEALDRVPTRDSGRWYRKGGWGCRLALHRFWWIEDDRG